MVGELGSPHGAHIPALIPSFDGSNPSRATSTMADGNEHVPETTFADAVINYFKDEYPNCEVEREPYLQRTGRWADLLVETKDETFIVEVENDFEAMFKGIGQVLVYSAHSHEYIPIVAVPEGHVDEPEWTMMKKWVRGITVEYDE